MSDEISTEDFVFRAPLYSEIELGVSDFRKFCQSGAIKLHGPCLDCEKTTIYSNTGPDPLRQAIGMTENIIGGFTVIFECQKNREHKLNLSLHGRQSTKKSISTEQKFISVTKTGQFPAMIDLARDEYIHLKKIMDQTDYRELNRAIGLASHGANVAAFVYLRRIFERLIYSTAENAGLHNEEFEKLRMSEKVLRLSEHLPNFVIQERRIYTSLSAGLHSWSEEECAVLFTILREAILLIFEEIKVSKERSARQAIIRKALNESS